VSGALAITIDVDGEAGLPDGGRGWEHRLSSRSERVYGVVRGLPRILGVLADANAPATVFFPGVTAERHPGAVAAVAAAGHELALHGHSHRRLDEMSAYQQRADLEAGLRAFDAIAGRTPAGYRAPAWELTPVTLELLVEHGFHYDSSLMGDDRPYMLEAAGGRLLELPIHWSLDDAPHFAAGGTPDALLAVLLAELDAAVAGDRLLTITFHPEILGRPSRVPVLRSLLDAAGARGCPVTALHRCTGL
jgi:peptidoglycan/xylan/chitin deacetylase (PgdA/CDA1 family)